MRETRTKKQLTKYVRTYVTVTVSPPGSSYLSTRFSALLPCVIDKQLEHPFWFFNDAFLLLVSFV